jgi:LysM repeat protein
MNNSSTISRDARMFIRNATVVAVVTLSAIGFVSGQAATANNQSSAADLQYVTIQSGQSLWALAAELAPSQDPRDWIADVVSLNALTSAEVQPGQQIALP